MLDLILIETDDMRPQLQQQITISDNASDANLIEMIVKLMKGSGWDPLDLRDRLIEEFPLEEEMDPWEEIELELVDADEPEPVSPCDGCEETCEDTACLKREDYDY